MSSTPVEITRYPNRRLYDRSRGQYVTLPEIEERVRAGETVVVRDSKTGEDLTRSVLVQILLERHPERIDLIPAPLLHLVLRANDWALDWLRAYLRQTLSFLENLPAAPFPAIPPFLPPATGSPTAPSFASPMTMSMDWMKAFFPNWGPTAEPAPSAEAAPPSDAGTAPENEKPATPPESAAAEPQSSADPLAARLAELERRLRELEAQRP